MKVVALSGGVGGARMVDGLAAVLPPADVTVIVNTGDDFTHWGLHISPDIDTVMYTLAGLAHPKRGWGLAEESFETLAMMKRLGGDDWFQLGDRDLATHIQRSDGLRQGRTLSEVTAELCASLGVQPRLLPMCDAPRPTTIVTQDGRALPFQDWLVGERGAPLVAAIRSTGTIEPAPGVLDAIAEADLVVLCPSNPFVSLDPILGLAWVRDRVATRPVVGVSPIVGGRAVKGPLAEMVPALLGEPASAAFIARYYDDVLDGLVVESGDEGHIALPTLATATVMGDRADRARLARELLEFAETAMGPAKNPRP